MWILYKLPIRLPFTNINITYNAVVVYILLQSISASLFNVSECLVHEDCGSKVDTVLRSETKLYLLQTIYYFSLYLLV